MTKETQQLEIEAAEDFDKFFAPFLYPENSEGIYSRLNNEEGTSKIRPMMG